MKIRIEDNSVRFRLRRSEVSQLAREGSLESVTAFPDGLFKYALEASPGAHDLRASYFGNTITVEIPKAWVLQWPESEKVGFDTLISMKNGQLHILIEKDFICLDRSPATQSDQYPNPNADP